MNTIVEMFTDGACRGNPGPGGWGVLLRYHDHERRLHGGENHTTNNRMELMAALKGLLALTRSCHVRITTDSQYLQRGITEWLPHWKQRGWKTKNKKSIKNLDLWQQLDIETAKHNITWHWVKGHSGHPENDIADALANRGIDELNKE